MYDLSARNPLVNTKETKLWFVDFDKTNAAKIYKKQQFYKKEYNLQTALLVTHFIRWKSLKKDVFYTSPLLYTPIQIVKNQKIKLQYNIQILDDEQSINPILQHEFKNSFNIDLMFKEDSSVDFINHLKQQLETNGDYLKLNSKWNDVDEWQIIETKAIGNFNYNKSVLAKDYEAIIKTPNTSVLSILGEGSVSPTDTKQTTYLANVDKSQATAIDLALNQNLVIHGPPGTGKSHTIVELIKQFLLQNKSILFVSEKKSALDVVYGKLKKDNLNHLAAYFNSDKNQKKEFYANLKRSIDKLFSFQDSSEPINSKIEELERYFQSYSQTLSHKKNNTEPSILELVSFLAEHQVNDFDHNKQIKIPDYSLWFNYIQFVEDLEHVAITNFKVTSISELPFIALNKSAFLETNPLAKIETRLQELGNWLADIKSILENYGFTWSWTELNKYCLASSVLNMANASQLDILDPNSKNYKSFDTWTKKYELTQNKLKFSDELCLKWTTKPKLADIDSIIEDVKVQDSKSFWLKFKKSISNEAFKNYSGDLSNDLKLKALENLKDNYLLKSTLDELSIKLKHNLNILNPNVDINHLLQLRRKLDTLSSNQYVNILEHHKSLQLIEDLHQLHPNIQKCNQIIKFLFVDFKTESINEMIQQIKTIQLQSSQFNQFLPEIKKTLNLPHELLNFVKNNDDSIDNLTKLVVFNAYLEKVRFEPTLKNLASVDILQHFKSLKTLKKAKNNQLKQEINHKWTNNRQNIEVLLNTPASKLTPKEKAEKQRQKQAKRVIFHEIAKKQQHLSIKNLVKETNHVIFDNQPLWIMNPLSIAENLPNSKDLFDVVIFDESSQIPLEDALPAIYRSKQVVVVGDSKQMPPSQFFSSSTESVTLLNQADSTFKSQLLTWHYRSEHPLLMQFSNQHFYDNELCYFPAVTANNPIEFLKIENGIFEDGKNKNEALKVAKTYAAELKNGHKNIAIIAFSKEQEKQIESDILKLTLPENKNLQIRNLENSQGIESDIVIISIGYGFNQEGNFRMNFGPINQDYGANRLNVLLTRSKQKMIIVTSVESTDFKLSENRGVQLLRDFLIFAEQGATLKQQQPKQFIHKAISQLTIDLDVSYYSALNGLAVNCFVQHSTQKVLLIDPSLHANENKDVYTILSVLNDRFKKVKILLSHDYWQNKKRFDIDIKKFFT